MKRLELKKIFLSSADYAGKTVTVCGWARTIRDSKSFGFIELNDGSYFKNCQVVFARENVANYDEIAKQNVGACLAVTGKFLLTPENKQPFEINAGGNPTPQFCDNCATKYEGRNWKVCPICRKLFPSAASDKTVTCSKECSAEWKRRTHEGVSNKWNEASKAKKRGQGQTENLKMGTPAPSGWSSARSKRGASSQPAWVRSAPSPSRRRSWAPAPLRWPLSPRAPIGVT